MVGFIFCLPTTTCQGNGLFDSQVGQAGMVASLQLMRHDKWAVVIRPWQIASGCD